MKILDPNFKIPENPCDDCWYYDEDCHKPIPCISKQRYEDQMSILSQIRDVDLNKLLVEYRIYLNNWVENCVDGGIYPVVKSVSFEDFIKEKVK